MGHFSIRPFTAVDVGFVVVCVSEKEKNKGGKQSDCSRVKTTCQEHDRDCFLFTKYWKQEVLGS